MLVDDGFKPHWIENHPVELYHADKTTVSSTGLRKVLKSPALFKAEVIDGNSPDPTDAMKFGTLVHQVILEGAAFLKTYVVMPEFVGRTLDGRESTQSKDAKLKRENWLNEQAAERRIVVTQQEFDDIRGMLDSVINHKDAFALLKDGVTEISGYYRDDETGIKCRIRPDFLQFNLMAVVDLKTTRDCTADDFSRTVWNFGYHTQIAMYGHGAEQISGKKVDYHAFIAVEKTKPYDCAVYLADHAMLEKGMMDYRAALQRMRKCIDDDQWPGYQTKMQDLGLPLWALRD